VRPAPTRKCSGSGDRHTPVTVRGSKGAPRPGHIRWRGRPRGSAGEGSPRTRTLRVVGHAGRRPSSDASASFQMLHSWVGERHVELTAGEKVKAGMTRLVVLATVAVLVLSGVFAATASAHRLNKVRAHNATSQYVKRQCNHSPLCQTSDADRCRRHSQHKVSCRAVTRDRNIGYTLTCTRRVAWTLRPNGSLRGNLVTSWHCSVRPR
jgi:hypothetical protein